MLKASCLCVTFDRVELLEEALESFLRQTWPNRELIVLNDCAAHELVFAHPLVRIVNSVERYPSLGAKRNACARLATGDVYFAWDDDDIYLPRNIEVAMRHLARGYYSPSTHLVLRGGALRMSVRGGLHGASAFTRELFEASGGYPELRRGEDLELRRRMHRLGRGIAPIEIGDEDVTFIYRYGDWVHASSRGTLPTPDPVRSPGETAGSRPTAIRLEPLWLDDYPQLVRTVLAANADAGADRRDTLVSCLFVSRNGSFVGDALVAFDRQDHAARELVVVSGATPLARQLDPARSPVRLLDPAPGLSETARWKLGLAACRADWVALWDESTYYFPWHLSTALRALPQTAGMYKPDRWLEQRGEELVVTYDTGLAPTVIDKSLLARAVASMPDGELDEDALFEALRRLEPRLGPFSHEGDDHISALHYPASPAEDEHARRGPTRVFEIAMQQLAPYGRARRPHIFAHIPKSAGSSVASWLHLAAGHVPLRAQPVRGLERIAWGIVRDPWSRALSNYQFTQDPGGYWRRHAHQHEVSALDFERFLELSLELRPATRRISGNATGVTMGPQIEFLVDTDGNLLADLVLRHEHLLEDLAWLSATIDGPSVDELPHVNASPRGPGREIVFEENPRLIDLVSARFREDITALGYAFAAEGPDIPVFCINGATARARWARMRDISRRRGYPTERVEAVAADEGGVTSQLPAHEASRVLSHARALERFLDTGREWGLILEDEVTLVRPYKSLRYFPLDADFIFFAWWWVAGVENPVRLRPFHRLRGRLPRGTQCYAVRREAARYLLQNLRALPVDVTLAQRYRMLLSNLVVYAAGYRIDPYVNRADLFGRGSAGPGPHRFLATPSDEAVASRRKRQRSAGPTMLPVKP